MRQKPKRNRKNARYRQASEKRSELRRRSGSLSGSYYRGPEVKAEKVGNWDPKDPLKGRWSRASRFVEWKEERYLETAIPIYANSANCGTGCSRVAKWCARVSSNPGYRGTVWPNWSRTDLWGGWSSNGCLYPEPDAGSPMLSSIALLRRYTVRLFELICSAGYLNVSVSKKALWHIHLQYQEKL